MQIGMIGLGKMGKNMAARLVQGGHEVVVFNRSAAPMREMAKLGAIAADSLDDLVAKLKAPRVIWMMLPAGKPTEDNFNILANLLQKKDILIDGGNAFYRNSIRRASVLQDKQIDFLDIGVSGGVCGLQDGYCLMAGGDKDVYSRVEPILKTLATENGYAYIAGSGSGHFVKMVHNGIEYAMLQSYAEGLDIIHSDKNWNIDLEPLCKLWNRGSIIRSWLLQLAADAFHDDANLEKIKGFVEDSGEGRWTVATAIENDVPAPTITAALFERFHSRRSESFAAKFIAALRNKFGGHKIKTVG